MAIRDIEVLRATPRSVAGTWTWSNTNTPPPASGGIRSNTSNWQLSTVLYLSNLDSGSADCSAQLAAVHTGDKIHLQDAVDGTKFANYVAIAEPAADAGFYIFNVTYADGASTGPNNGAAVTVEFYASPLPSPPVGHMYFDLTLNSGISDQMAQDLMTDITDNLQTVTHLVNYADCTANVSGVILTHSADILPAMTGDVTPIPDPDWPSNA